MTNDSLQLDTALIARLQQEPQYDYARELVNERPNLLSWFIKWLGRQLEEVSSTIFNNDATEYILIAIGVVVLALSVWLILRRKSFFVRQEEGNLPYQVIEDTIYGIDFDADIRKAMQRADYRMAVRLVYLQTLRYLSDVGRIDWKPSKTAMQYVRQLKDGRFTEFSDLFVRVRYGNFEADRQMVLRMQELQAQMKGGAHA